MGKDKVKPQEVKPEFIISVTAKDKDGAELGKGKAYAYTENEAGLNAAIRRMKHKAIVKLINRQLKTDKRNDLARPESDMIKTKCKVMISLIQGNAKLKDVFITEVKTWTHLENAIINSIVEILKAA